MFDRIEDPADTHMLFENVSGVVDFVVGHSWARMYVRVRHYMKFVVVADEIKFADWGPAHLFRPVFDNRCTLFGEGTFYV